jgi:hypothetical protein
MTHETAITRILALLCAFDVGHNQPTEEEIEAWIKSVRPSPAELMIAAETLDEPIPERRLN